MASRVKKSPSPSDLLALLSGGNARTLQGVTAVIEAVTIRPALFSTLITAMSHEDRAVAARAADAAEKLSAVNPALLNSHVTSLLNRLARSEYKEIRWHVAQMLPRLPLSSAQARRAVRLLERYLIDESSIVKTCAMQSLYELALRYPRLRESVRLHIDELSETGTPAMRARGRKLLALM
jgi:hypothetical protein